MNEGVKEYVRQELKKAEQALKAAQNLLADELYDDAVSRAYYAVFHGARAALRMKGVETISHKGLVNQFALHLVKPGEVDEEYGDILRQTKEDRETGDYEPLVSFDSEEAAQLVSGASRFLARMQEWIRKISG